MAVHDMVRNILKGGMDQTELLQSYVRNDNDSDDEEISTKDLSRKTKMKQQISSSIPLPGISGIPSSPPKRDIYTPRVRKEASTMSDSKTIAAEHKGSAIKEKTLKIGKGSRGNVRGKKAKNNKGGKRRKKRSARGEEVYTDKDRAAAVNMGSKDIKQSLSIKLKEDRSKALHMPEEAEPATFLALGHNEIRNGGDLKVALGFVKKALELNPRDKEALVARSRCYILLGEADNALKDAETALSIDKNYIPAIYQKAESLYFLGQFEHSLMYYHRGLRFRPELQKFRLGVQKAQEAIENTIGPLVKLGTGFVDSSQASTRPPSRPGTKGTQNRPKLSSASSGAMINGSLANQNLLPPQQSKDNGPKSRAQTAIPRVKSTPTIPTIKKNTTRQLLGALSVDKQYLENLLKQPHLKCLDKENKAVISKAEEALEFLNNRQKFWEQQLPPPGLCKKPNSSVIAHR